MRGLSPIQEFYGSKEFESQYKLTQVYCTINIMKLTQIRKIKSAPSTMITVPKCKQTLMRHPSSFSSLALYIFQNSSMGRRDESRLRSRD